MKNTLNFCIVLIAIFVFLIPFCFIALLVRIKLGSPIFFIQERPGKDGKVFRMIKFRSMLDANDKNGTPLHDDERLNTFGKLLRSTSLDEIPELINVLKGEMNIVGPRPLLVEYLPLYSAEQARRHDVRPGMTGWAQINGRNTISWEEKFELDIWYVENQSIILDLKIMFLTVWKIVKRSDITQDGQETVEYFKGNNAP